MKTKFRIPPSANVIVRCLGTNGKFSDFLIPRPANNDVLRLTMLGKGIGHSQIRAVKSDRETLPAQSADLNSLAHRWA